MSFTYARLQVFSKQYVHNFDVVPPTVLVYALKNEMYVKVQWSRYRPGVAQRVGGGVALLFQDRGTRRGWVVSSTSRPHFTPGKDPVPILQEAGWAPRQVWTGGKSRPHRDFCCCDSFYCPFTMLHGSYSPFYFAWMVRVFGLVWSVLIVVYVLG